MKHAENQPDDIRKLLGGYATGSLTEAERRLLFDAAMEDQELFDQIAGEYDLKDILDEPGARQRLLAALDANTRAAWWSKPWTWAAGGAVALFVGVVIAVSNRAVAPPPSPQVIAQVMKSEQAAPQSVEAPPAPVTLRKKVTAPPPEVAMDKPSDAAPRAAVAQRMELSSVQAFAFHYTVGADGFLEIIPASAGFLSVTANTAVIFPSRAVTAGTPVRIQIPAEATNLVVGFSAAAGITGPPVRRDETSGTVADQDPPNQRISIQLFLTPRTQ